MRARFEIRHDDRPLVRADAEVLFLEADDTPDHPFDVEFSLDGLDLDGATPIGMLFSYAERRTLADAAERAGGIVALEVECGGAEHWACAPRRDGSRLTLEVRPLDAPPEDGLDVDGAAIWRLLTARQKDLLAEARLARRVA